MCKIMKKIVTILLAFMAVAAQALTVQEAAGTYKGLLNIGGQEYPNKEVYILPGTEANSITFVLPDFRYNGAPLGDIVLVNLPMSAEGQLSLEDATLYIRAISERATISVINGLEDGGTVYNSVITSSSAQVLLSIGAPSLPEDILVLFAGTRENSKNYAVTNGGFEGSWSNGEPTGWHSFNSATGDYVSFVQNTEQFTQSSEADEVPRDPYDFCVRSAVHNIVADGAAELNRYLIPLGLQPGIDVDADVGFTKVFAVQPAAGDTVGHIAAELPVGCAGVNIGAASPISERIDLRIWVLCPQISAVCMTLADD